MGGSEQWRGRALLYASAPLFGGRTEPSRYMTTRIRELWNRLRVKEGVRSEPMKFEDNMLDVFTLESVLEAKFVKTNRGHFDRGNLQSFLRRVNRRYGPFEPVRIIEDKSFKVEKRELVTKYVIYYR